MPISVVCPLCQKKLKVADEAAGKRAHCPLCKRVITIPQAEEFVEPDEFVEPEEETAVSAAPKKPKKKAAWDDPEGETPEKSGDTLDFEEPVPEKRKRRRYADDDRFSDGDEEERAPRHRIKKRRRPNRGVAFPGWFDPFIAGAAVLGVIGLVFIGAALIFPPLAALPILLGSLLCVIGWIWLLMVAFQNDVMAGILCIVLPFYGLVYVASNFEDCKHQSASGSSVCSCRC